LAPYKVAVLPLQKKLNEKAEEIYANLSKKFSATFDETGSIGKRYRRQDEIGTPFCLTIDFDTLEDGCVTVRERDTMSQIRIPIEEVENYLSEQLVY
jgi:glycyl-tRNA synthetase